jgi:hypothetical protein
VALWCTQIRNIEQLVFDVESRCGDLDFATLQIDSRVRAYFQADVVVATAHDFALSDGDSIAPH